MLILLRAFTLHEASSIPCGLLLLSVRMDPPFGSLDKDPWITGNYESALSLLVLRILANDHDAAFALDDLALLTDRLYRRTYFQDYFSFLKNAWGACYFARQTIRPLVRS